MTSLYSINLVTGAAVLVGPIATGSVTIRGLAIEGAAVAGGLPAIALASGNNIVRFNTATTGTATIVFASGLVAGESLAAIDWRPQTGQLFGLGVNGVANTGTLYLIDPQTGAATTIGVASAIQFAQNDGVTTVDLLDPTIGYGFDFNPTVDRIRVLTNTGLNFRINPNNGAPVDGNGGAPGTNADTAINGLPGRSTGVSAAAYTNSFGQTLAGGLTNLFVLDPTSNMLFIQNSANGGVLIEGTTVTLDGTTPLDFTAANGFDFLVGTAVNSTTATEKPNGMGMAALTVGGVNRIYAIAPRGARATLVGASPSLLTALTLGDGPAFPTTTALNGTPNPALAGQTMTFTATVTPTHAVGIVRFTDNGVGISGCLNVEVGFGGVARCTTTFAAPGITRSWPRSSPGRIMADPPRRRTRRRSPSGSAASSTVVTAHNNPSRLTKTCHHRVRVPVHRGRPRYLPHRWCHGRHGGGERGTGPVGDVEPRRGDASDHRDLQRRRHVCGQHVADGVRDHHCGRHVHAILRGGRHRLFPHRRRRRQRQRDESGARHRDALPGGGLADGGPVHARSVDAANRRRQRGGRRYRGRVDAGRIGSTDRRDAADDVGHAGLRQHARKRHPIDVDDVGISRRAQRTSSACIT